MNQDVSETSTPALLADRFVRLLAALGDFFLILTFLLLLFVSMSEKTEIFILLYIIHSMVLDVLIKKSPGKLFLGLEIQYQKDKFFYRFIRSLLKTIIPLFAYLTILDAPKRRGWHDRAGKSIVVQYPTSHRILKGIGFLTFSLYLFLLIGVNRFFEYPRDKDFSQKKVRVLPQKKEIPPLLINQSLSEIQLDNIQFNIPGSFSGMKLYYNHLGIFYASDQPDHSRHPPLIIAPLQDFHPITFCENKETHFYYSFYCGLPPDQLQKVILEANPMKRWIILNPLTRFKLNWLVMYKNICLMHERYPLFIRHIQKKESSIFWIGEAEPNTKNADHSITETIYIADHTRYQVICLVWRRIPRDENLVWQVLRTLIFTETGKLDIQKEIELAKQERSIERAAQVYRLSKKKYECAELLYELLTENGSYWEKKYFARSIQKEKEQDLRFQKLVFLTRHWQE